jgi:glutamate formiminotransferase
LTQIVECVPNFSEGRDRTKVEAIRAVIQAAGVRVLDLTMDADHNRSVITYAGEPEAALRAAVEAAGKAVELIDLRVHAGVHPRIGAMDVLPFVPLDGVVMEQCCDLALRAAEEIWRRYRVPSFLYEAAARLPHRRNLAEVRRRPLGTPDIGGPQLHPSAGAVAVGARKFLIAFNVNLDSRDVKVARRIAAAVRESSGGLACVKALGLELASRGLVQVSLNLTDFEVTPVQRALAAVQREAEKENVRVVESELIGLIPRRAWELSGGEWDESRILENRLAALK